MAKPGPLNATPMLRATACLADRGSDSRPSRARLRVTHVHLWPVIRTAMIMSAALTLAGVGVVVVVWGVLEVAGVWDGLEDRAVEEMGNTSWEFVARYLTTSRIAGLVCFVAAVNVVLMTVIAAVVALGHNLASSASGGIEITTLKD